MKPTIRFCCTQRFVIWLLEKGKRQYGVGLTHQLIMVVDRSPPQNKHYSLSFGPSAASNLPIMRAIFSAVQVSINPLQQTFTLKQRLFSDMAD